jgi:hypothetical protein
LALIYALLDRSPRIERVHLDAALAVWTFCESSARYIFGDLIGEPLADEILRVLRQIGAGGMNRLDLYGMFFPSHSKDKIGAALVRLLTAGKVRREAQKGSHGLAGERWFAI